MSSWQSALLAGSNCAQDGTLEPYQIIEHYNRYLLKLGFISFVSMSWIDLTLRRMMSLCAQKWELISFQKGRLKINVWPKGHTKIEVC